ncbi:hypothetical protein B0I26_10421 [Anoxybacillus vitaminiphilus]|uniref:Uncharacterized protein n=1 Tax=Paranoxybacillus vitaminiphilus TaxID=581036 RepID=A0A327YHB0_9BACL|nr:hypothetical protein B0I26_10421 [Anoxybacillus vitaminiphilus]
MFCISNIFKMLALLLSSQMVNYKYLYGILYFSNSVQDQIERFENAYNS